MHGVGAAEGRRRDFGEAYVTDFALPG
jgi:hypothetical protein